MLEFKTVSAKKDTDLIEHSNWLGISTERLPLQHSLNKAKINFRMHQDQDNFMSLSFSLGKYREFSERFSACLFRENLLIHETFDGK